MIARQLMTKDIEVCMLNDTVARAIEIMKRRNCGFVPIVADLYGKVLKGVVTDRDLVLFLGHSDMRPSEVLLKNCYNPNPKSAFEDTDIHDVEALMRDCNVHRVPVINKDGKILGVISLKDLAEEAWAENDLKKPEITETEIGKVVDQISINQGRIWKKEGRHLE